MDEAEEDEVELFEAREDTAESLETAKQSFDFIASLVHLAIIFPWVDSLGGRRHHGREPQGQSQLAGFVAFVCSIPDQGGMVVLLTQAIQQLTSFWSVVGLSRGE